MKSPNVTRRNHEDARNGDGDHQPPQAELESRQRQQRCVVRSEEGSKSGMIQLAAGEFPRTSSRIIPCRLSASPNSVRRSQAVQASAGRGAGSGNACRARARSSWAVSFGFSSAMRVSQSESAVRGRRAAGRNSLWTSASFCDEPGFVLRVAGKHDDEFADFELGQHIRFAKRFVERRFGDVEHLPRESGCRTSG